MQGIIIKNISNDYTVKVNEEEYICKPRGKFRLNNVSPLVGDIVNIDGFNNYILEILPRKNSLIRPPIANIDQAVIVMSIAKPDFSDNLLDKLLTVITFNKIKPIICFTKFDLLKKDELEEKEKFVNYYKNIGYEVYKNTELDKLNKIFKDKVTVFTGQSGAGKSTLLNKLMPSLNLKTDEISMALGRGKHTTRHVELIRICDGLIADTPGFSSLDLSGISNIDIRNTFKEFNIYAKCPYHDCMHDKEIDCNLKEYVGSTVLKSRYNNYLKFIREEKNASSNFDTIHKR